MTRTIVPLESGCIKPSLPLYLIPRTWTGIKMETAPNTNNSGANSDSARARLMTLATAAADGYRNLSLSADGGSTDKIAGAACWYSSSYVPVFNGAGIFDPHLITRETLSAIEAYFKWRGRPYSVMSLDALVPYAA